MELDFYAADFNIWLRKDALPIWWQQGADQQRGGFVEMLELDGRPSEAARRGRVQPRQIYCYALAGKMGWDGPWQQALTHGLEYFQKRFWIESGYYANLVAPDGELIDPGFDLYNQAFALFGFAQAVKAVPSLRGELEHQSLRLLQMLKERFSHPETGFENDLDKSVPLKSNPHMHLFEAALAWEDICECVGPWSTLADEIATLCLDRFIDPKSGALREFFGSDWSPFEGELGRIVEPGHQFEWAWLLTRWGQRRGDGRAVIKAERLYEIGLEYGICPTRKVAVMSLRDDFSTLDPTARLWPQTEWLKSSLRLAAVSGSIKRGYYLRAAEQACAAMRLFLEVPKRGLWRDKMQPDGTFVDEPAPASSFYHIACAIDELWQHVQVPV